MEFGHLAGAEFGHVELGHRLGHFHFGAHREAGHFLGHFACVGKTLDELGDIFGFDARSARDAAAARAINHVGIFPFLAAHRHDDGFGLVEFLFRNLNVFEGSADAGKESHQLLERAHFTDGTHLFEEVVEGEGGFRHFFLKLGGPDFIEFGLCFFDEGKDVAHAEHALGDALGMEFFEGVQFFADADEFDRLAGDGADGECGAAAGIGVELGENNSV